MGIELGDMVGSLVVGLNVGPLVGVGVGTSVGLGDGNAVGLATVGSGVGDAVVAGLLVG